MARLGKPGEKRYKPKPIKRFLDWYRKQADVEYERRREREVERRKGIAERRAERERISAERERILYGHEAGIEERSAEQEELLMKLGKELDRMYALYDRQTQAIENYSDYFQSNPMWTDERGRQRGWDFSKPSYLDKRDKRDRLLERHVKLEKEMTELENRIMRLAEALIVFMRGR